MSNEPDQTTIRQMLDNVEAVVKSRFYEDPDPIASPIEMFRIRDGQQGGEPFTVLTRREKWQVLGDYTHWHDYEERGVSFEQLDQVFSNVIDGKPRDQWLEGTGLDGGPNLTLEKLKALGERMTALGEELAGDAALAKAEEEQRRRIEKFGSLEHDAPKVPKKDRDMER